MNSQAHEDHIISQLEKKLPQSSNTDVTASIILIDSQLTVNLSTGMIFVSRVDSTTTPSTNFDFENCPVFTDSLEDLYKTIELYGLSYKFMAVWGFTNGSGESNTNIFSGSFSSVSKSVIKATGQWYSV